MIGVENGGSVDVEEGMSVMVGDGFGVGARVGGAGSVAVGV